MNLNEPPQSSSSTRVKWEEYDVAAVYAPILSSIKYKHPNTFGEFDPSFPQFDTFLLESLASIVIFLDSTPASETSKQDLEIHVRKAKKIGKLLNVDWLMKHMSKLASYVEYREASAKTESLNAELERLRSEVEAYKAEVHELEESADRLKAELMSIKGSLEKRKAKWEKQKTNIATVVADKERAMATSATLHPDLVPFTSAPSSYGLLM